MLSKGVFTAKEEHDAVVAQGIEWYKKRVMPVLKATVSLSIHSELIRPPVAYLTQARELASIIGWIVKYQTKFVPADSNESPVGP